MRLFTVVLIFQVIHRIECLVYSGKISGLLFDCDGVLAETEPDAHRPAFNQVFRERGFSAEWDKELYGKLLETGGGKERMTAYWNEVGWPNGYESEEAQQELVKELHLAKTEKFNEIIDSGSVPLRPGVERLINEALKAQVPVGVCSTSNERAVTNLVKTLLPEAFPSMKIFAGDIVANKKPAPDVYLLAADSMELDPMRCVVIEDSSIGLASAKAAGMTCVITTSSYAYTEDFTLADLIVSDLDNGKISLSVLENLLP